MSLHCQTWLLETMTVSRALTAPLSIAFKDDFNYPISLTMAAPK
ncbi:hypothetical protein [Methylotenera sp.]|nr:hypothetical protein [Methylotenera sp.]